MKRWDIINEYVQKYNYQDYLEIGLCSGICRDSVCIKNKTTVDPSQQSNNPTHLMTSDEFFMQNDKTYDVIFIDGLHEANQVYIDILNSLEVLNENGTILCHDMLPTSEIIQAVPRVNSIWTGDCWKAWAKLRGTRENLEMQIVESDWGVGIIRVGKQEIKKHLDIEMSKMDWNFFKENSKFFNKISVSELKEQLQN